MSHYCIYLIKLSCGLNHQEALRKGVTRNSGFMSENLNVIYGYTTNSMRQHRSVKK